MSKRKTKISKEKVRKITNEIRRKRKGATTRGVTRHGSKRFKQDDKPCGHSERKGHSKYNLWFK